MVESAFTPIEALTERETEVLYAMADGLSNQEISNTLFIALATVKWYNSQIYSKLGVSNRQEAVKQARVLGLLDSDKQDAPHVPNNLFQPTTPFIGRYKELGELDTLLQSSEVRLITVLAPGGMGKTRLILHVAQQQLTNFPDGIFFVELAPVVTAEAIVPALIEVLQLEGYDNSLKSREAMLHYLQHRCLLLVMDNFEHLLDGASIINDILQAAPQVKVLVSSRERLNLQGENIYVLNGMSAPSLTSVNQTEYDAVRLYVDSTKRISADYDLPADDLAHILAICELVEGMPLGIELAAGWMDMLSPAQIAQELRTGIHILETDMRDIPERHRSMHATFDHSWEKLTDSEQLAMMSLSIFRGSFSHEAAATVAQANLLTLRRLVNKSLLYIDARGRYHIHELLRQYCEEKLRQTAKYEAVLDQHAHYYAEYLQNTRLRYERYDAIIHKEINIELDNLIMAWERILVNKDFGLLGKSISLSHYLARYHRNEFAIDILQQAIDIVQTDMGNDPALIRLYSHLAIERLDLLSYILGDKDNRIKGQLQEIFDLLEPLGFSEELVQAALTIGNPLIWDQAYYAQIRDNLTKLLQLSQVQNDEEWQIWILTFLASNEYKVGNTEQAWDYFEQANVIEESYELNTYFNLWTRLMMADMYIEAEKYQEAKSIIEEGIEAVERTEDIYGISMCRNYQAQIALKRNDIQEVKTQIAAIIRWHQAIAAEWESLGTLWGNYVVWFLMPTGDDVRAVEVCSFVMHHPDVVQVHVEGCQESLDTLHQRIDEDVFNAAFERGKRLTFKQVMTDALTRLTSPEP